MKVTRLLVLLTLLHSSVTSAENLILDDFEDPIAWHAIASEGARIQITEDRGHSGKGMRVDFDFTAGSGYVIIHKDLPPLDLPDNYAFSFYLRAEAPVNHTEFKLIDASGQNVWWRQRRHFSFPTEWKPFTVKKQHLRFASGPAGGGEIKKLGAIELTISVDTGVKGSVWIDDLRLKKYDPAPTHELTPLVRASTASPNHGPEQVLDQNPATFWESGEPAEEQWLLIDFLNNREYGGLQIDWDRDNYATAYEVQISENGRIWKSVYTVTAGNGQRDYIYLPDTESRYLKLALKQSSQGQGYQIRTIAIKPYEFSASPNQFFEVIARDAPRGLYPKYFYGEQSYWTVIGAHDDDHEGLLNEEGILEIDQGAFSIEPFLYADGKLITWDTVTPSQELEQGYLPIPSVSWQYNSFSLLITVFAVEEQPGKPALYARYRVRNTETKPQQINLYLALRPFQVNPPWQDIMMAGGATPIRELSYDQGVVWVNRDQAVIPLTPPDRFGAVAFDQGAVTDFILGGKLPSRQQVVDSFGYASGVLSYRMDLPPEETREVYLRIPYSKSSPSQPLTAQTAVSLWNKHHDAVTHYWQTKLGRVGIQLPPSADRILHTLKSSLAYILINRDGPAIQPGSRNYARSWIRDGALTSAALLEMGYTEEVRDFIKWFAKHQFPDGKVPCCVDHRGRDPLPEHDSHGEFIYLLMEYYRHTRDVGLLNQRWPQAIKAVEYIDSLRQQRLTEHFKTPENQPFYGIMPESISHEGYAPPVHAYWDNFWTLRGLKDAAGMAEIIGDEERTPHFAGLRDVFRQDLYGSLARTMEKHKTAYLPASVELGDFDPPAIAIAVNPNGELRHLPEAALYRTFEDYYTYFQKRRNSEVSWDAIGPYELRIVGTLIRLGWRERALEMLEFFLAHQRPKAWNHWTEIIWRDPHTPRFIGDMPHTWIGSEFIRAVRSLFVYENEADRTLIIAAGVPRAWAESETGISLKRLSTHYGTLNYSLRKIGPGELRFKFSGDIALAPGKMIVTSPLDEPLQGVIVNGKAIDSFDARKAIVSEFPAEVVLQYGVIAETDPALEKPGPTSPKSKTVLTRVPGASLKTDG
jgi:hypothetical protein